VSEPSDNDLPFGPEYWKQRVAEIGAKSHKDFHGEMLRGPRFGEFVGAVRELIAALPKCCEFDGHARAQCRATATRVRGVWANEGVDYAGQEHFCEAHAPLGTPALDYAPALRKLQAMLDPEETT